MNNTPSTEERIWAVLSHLSAIAFGMGLLLPVIGWSEQRRKSKYASFQCLQALGYQSLGYTVWFLAYIVLMTATIFVVVMVVSFIETSTGRSNVSLGMGTGIVLSIFFLGGFALYFILPVIAAISCALGRDFRYPIMGDRLARYLGYIATQETEQPTRLIEDHEERWVSAMGHFSVIIMMFGMLAPVAAWVLQGRHSLFLKFQSIQTIIYQILVTILYFSQSAIGMFGVLVALAFVGLEGNFDSGSSTAGMGVVIFILTMIISMLIGLLLPLFHILGQWAGYRVLKGDDYHYPLIGKLAESWVSQKTISVVEEKPV